MAGWLHLAKRFVQSLDPRGPVRVDETWALTQLTDGEIALWQAMSRVDRRHACGVARRVEASLGTRASRPVLAAALLHDVGKIDSRLGTAGRVIATLSARLAGADMAGAWSETRGFTRRVGLYLRHDEIGADRLALAGSDPLTVDWAREHHRPQADWTVALELADALKTADDD